MSSSNDGPALPTPNQAIAQIHQEDQFHVVDLEQNEKSATGGHDAYVALSNPELEKRGAPQDRYACPSACHVSM